MGTDIHLAAEVFEDGRWHLAEVDLPDYRNYRAFAVLADVRNGYTLQVWTAAIRSSRSVIHAAFQRTCHWNCEKY